MQSGGHAEYWFMRCTLFLLLYSVSVWSQSESQSDVAQDVNPLDDAIEEVLVIGEQPGPGLWRVYKGDHVLSILGTHSPLPKDMQWHSKSVESALSESQTYIAPPRVRVNLSAMQKIAVLPSLIGVRNNPNGDKLKEVLPEELYSRWLAQKQKYKGTHKSVEKWRPLFAIQALYETAREKNNLTSDSEILYIVNELAMQKKLTIVTPTLLKKLENPRAIVKQFKKSTVDDMACFTKIIDRLESGMGDVYAQANAWAKGDLPSLRQLPYPNPETICKNAVFNLSLLEEEGLQNIPQLQQDLWMAEAEKAIANNVSTFAALPIVDLVKPNGYLAALRAKGYEVEEP
jgi:uncharacterized protein YbaP (TraB family)